MLVLLARDYFYGKDKDMTEKLEEDLAMHLGNSICKACVGGTCGWGVIYDGLKVYSSHFVSIQGSGEYR